MEAAVQGERSESVALRAFLRGEVDPIDAADAAGIGVAEFLDLVDRVRVATQDVAAGAARARPEISVVVPMFNEEDNLDPLLERLVPVLEEIGTYEVVFVDDCSSDRSREVVLAAREANPSIRLVELARNFGHMGALCAGLDHAAGNSVVFMDADLQDPPEVLTDLVARWRDGYDVVYAVREKRKEGLLLRASFFVFYRLLRRVSQIDLPLDAGDFALMDRKVADALRSLPESNRFLRGLRGWVGFRQVGVHYERGTRLAGETKYTIRSRFRLAVDGLLSFSDLPLRISTFVGALAMLGAMVYLAVAVVAKLFVGDVPQGWTSTILVVLVIGGVQLLMMGVIGEYLARTYQETKRRPAYVIRAAHGVHKVGTAPDA